MGGRRRDRFVNELQYRKTHNDTDPKKAQVNSRAREGYEVMGRSRLEGIGEHVINMVSTAHGGKGGASGDFAIISDSW